MRGFDPLSKEKPQAKQSSHPDDIVENIPTPVEDMPSSRNRSVSNSKEGNRRKQRAVSPSNTGSLRDSKGSQSQTKVSQLPQHRKPIIHNEDSKTLEEGTRTPAKTLDRHAKSADVEDYGDVLMPLKRIRSAPSQLSGNSGLLPLGGSLHRSLGGNSISSGSLVGNQSNQSRHTSGYVGFGSGYAGTTSTSNVGSTTAGIDPLLEACYYGAVNIVRLQLQRRKDVPLNHPDYVWRICATTSNTSTSSGRPTYGRGTDTRVDGSTDGNSTYGNSSYANGRQRDIKQVVKVPFHTPLSAACNRGHIAIVTELLKHPDISLDVFRIPRSVGRHIVACREENRRSGSIGEAWIAYRTTGDGRGVNNRFNGGRGEDNADTLSPRKHKRCFTIRRIIEEDSESMNGSFESTPRKSSQHSHSRGSPPKETGEGLLQEVEGDRKRNQMSNLRNQDHDSLINRDQNRESLRDSRDDRSRHSFSHRLEDRQSDRHKKSSNRQSSQVRGNSNACSLENVNSFANRTVSSNHCSQNASMLPEDGQQNCIMKFCAKLVGRELDSTNSKARSKSGGKKHKLKNNQGTEALVLLQNEDDTLAHSYEGNSERKSSCFTRKSLDKSGTSTNCGSSKIHSSITTGPEYSNVRSGSGTPSGDGCHSSSTSNLHTGNSTSKNENSTSNSYPPNLSSMGHSNGNLNGHKSSGNLSSLHSNSSFNYDSGSTTTRISITFSSFNSGKEAHPRHGNCPSLMSTKCKDTSGLNVVSQKRRESQFMNLDDVMLDTNNNAELTQGNSAMARFCRTLCGKEEVVVEKRKVEKKSYSAIEAALDMYDFAMAAMLYKEMLMRRLDISKQESWQHVRRFYPEFFAYCGGQFHSSK